MASNIIGTVIEDLNRDGLNNNGENGVAGWTVFLDRNGDGTLNAGEPTKVTNIDGNYNFAAVTPGSYRVGVVGKSGYVSTTPASVDVVAPTTGSVRANFLVFSGGSIAGTIWNDYSQDGIRATDASGAFIEPGLAGWTVYLDTHNVGVMDADEPRMLTDENGEYHFSDLIERDYEVTEIQPAGWEISPTFDTKQTASVRARQTVHQDFANFSTVNGSIEGTIFSDINGSAIRDIDPSTGTLESGLEGWTVFLDANNNQVLDAGEQSALTDATGMYRFLSLAAGDYEAVEQLEPGWVVTTNDVRQTVTVTGGSVATASDFGNFTTENGSIEGKVWNDLNRNGIRDINPMTGAFTDPPLASWTIFLDLNRNKVADSGEPNQVTDTNGRYQFLNLQVGDYEVREVVKSGWETAPTFGDNQTVHVASGVNSIAGDFANFNVSLGAPGSVSGSVWNDQNENGVIDGSEAGLSGWTVFLDSNLDGIFNTGESTYTTTAGGAYAFSGLIPGTVGIGVMPTSGWKATAPLTNSITFTLRSGQSLAGQNFGEARLKDSSVFGKVYVDDNKNGILDVTDRGISGITVYIDLNNNSSLDAGEPSIVTSSDLYYTPAANEAGDYSFTHLAAGTYHIREILPAVLSATAPSELEHTVVITAAQNIQTDIKAAYRANEIHGIKFDDANGNHVRDAGESSVAGATIFVDLNRNNLLDAGESTTVTGADGSYAFVLGAPGSYVVREILEPGDVRTLPTSTGGILWPTGTSNPSVGNVTPTSITKSLDIGEKFTQAVSITLPRSGQLTDLVDVFLLFDDTGSFTSNSPIVRAAFPQIINSLNASLPGINLGFGVGRLEEYGNFASEYSTGRPFILNQPIVAATTAGYETAIQSALDRTTPGYGGDTPETDIEALYQLVTGKGFDGNNNGSVLDSGPAGLASTQVSPGVSGDVPSFASFTPDAAANVFPAAGNVGGAGFRSGSLPIILLATDTGFAYQPKGETSITGAGGAVLPVGQLTQTARASTPFNSGAGIQETITGLNALGALVIGIGTNAQTDIDPRQQLEAISTLTGATNQSTSPIENGTASPILPGDPLYFEISSGFGPSVANGVISAIQNAVTNVSVDIDVVASDPRVHIVNKTGVLRNIISGQTASFDIEFTGDGRPHRFDLQFVRAGTGVVLGSIPVVLGTSIPGDGYEYEDLEDGEIAVGDDFGSMKAVVPTAKFHVVDGTSRQSFNYQANGSSVNTTALGATNRTPRGIATSKDSSTSWVVEPDGTVYVYNNSGVQTGKWKAVGITKAEGIASDDVNVWIVDAATKKVFYFAGAATRKAGIARPTSSFALNTANAVPKDIVTDGSKLWVVNDAIVDSVFVYSTAGAYSGRWTIDTRNVHPTGITIDPNHLSNMWIVDSTTDRVYQYNAAVGLVSGKRTASSSFALATGNTNPQGISDPLPAPTWHNYALAEDVNNDGTLSPLDALTVINQLNRSAGSSLPLRELGKPFYDVNDDGELSPLDALLVINELNHRSSVVSAKSQSAPVPTDAFFIDLSFLDSAKKEERETLIDTLAADDRFWSLPLL